ncbi:MAG TPA: tryptophan 7-halogenase [Planctomycetaceae bacterium]|nr:tryptophan 7-halogenase [Planctomycetaceae bacterium]
MPSIKTEFLILGSGFGGSLLALILARAGKSVAMVDRSQHPRFAIGESSTPLADRTLAQIADRYGLPELQPLCQWGSWKRQYPQLLCGKKRGFTYFEQTGIEDLSPANFESQRLLVSASIDDEHSDTHWLRSDVDQFLFQLAQTSGVATFEHCQYDLSEDAVGWRLDGKADQQAISLQAPFLIDATGSSNATLKYLNVPNQTHLLKTNSRSIFAHFSGAKSCERLLLDRSIDISAFPYHCDDAAVHQVLPDGWMWQLRFDDDSLSAGFMIDERPGVVQASPSFATSNDEWNWRIRRSPFLSQQFESAQIVRPESGLQSTRRIQRLAGQGAGHNWAALTNTVGFVDPLHSTGIAHTLFSVSRLADILLLKAGAVARQQSLQHYSESLIHEIRCVDELVEGCYESIPSFRLWCLWGMLYFAAATSMEQTTDAGIGQASFLLADDRQFRTVLREARKQLAIARHVRDSERVAAETTFATWLKSEIEPWNLVGLFDDACDNLYARTAAPAEEIRPETGRTT